MLLKICLFPDPVLRTANARVETFDKGLEKTVQEMIRVMRSQPHGIGIAAPQLGISLQIAVVDVSPRDPNATLKVFINPQILSRQSEKLSREGCMSLPEYTGQLVRYETVSVRWQDLQGRHHQENFSGIESICVQHEIDHLNGVLFIDRLASLKRDLIPRPGTHSKRRHSS